MAVEVIGTIEFEEWFLGLGEDDQDAVIRVVDLLEMAGVTLEHPYSSKISASTFALREIRAQSKGRPLRVFYFFDPKRRAVLLIGGDKTGNDRFYEEFIPKAEGILKQYLSEILRQG